MDRFELGMLQDYFRNIMMACDNQERDERPYIRGVAEVGYDVLENYLRNEK